MNEANLKNYVVGFVASLALTLNAYVLVSGRMLPNNLLIGLVTVLALAQFIVQLMYFLHLGHEARPRWKLYVFIFMIVVVLLFVGGSLWIMQNLNYRMMPQNVETYMRDHEGI